MVADCSFISLRLILPPCLQFLKCGGQVLALVKPQFELGPEHAVKGVVRSEEMQLKAVAGIQEFAREELDVLTTELTRAFGLGGRERRAGKAAERARVNVQRRIKDAIGRIEKLNPAAARHLQWAVKTGMYCSYDPS